jgi:DNA modification methylase
MVSGNPVPEVHSEGEKAAAVWFPITALKPWERNPRNNTAAIAKVAESIRRFGFGSPILARKEDCQVIAGHTRLFAAQKLGLSHVPVRLLDLSQEDAQLLALADNRLGEIAEWDEEGLARVLADLKAADMDLSVTGFDGKEIDRLLAELNAGNVAAVAEPPLPEVPKVAQSKRGEVYQLGPHRIMCGDSTCADDVLKLMNGERAALMATDPPYLVDYDGGNHPQSFEREQAGKDNNKKWDAYVDPKTSVDFFASFLRVALAHALEPNPAIYQWHASRRQGLVEEAWRANGLLLHQQLIWVKSRPILTRSHFMWQHEPCFYGWVEGKPPTLRPAVSGENSTVWMIDGEQDGIHPTQKPLAIFERPISYHTQIRALVYEPFSGSGSQLIAAAKSGRRCNAMELAAEFVDVARIRWTNFARAAGLEPGPGALTASPQKTGRG